MKFKKVLFTGVISLSLLFTLTSAVVAEEMSGMNMEGQSTVQKSPETQTQPSGKANDHSNMDMSGKDSSSSSVTNKQHEATAGMDQNMPGMINNEENANANAGGHESSEGVDWMVVGSFLAINLLVIAIAGVLKFTKKTQAQILH